MNKQWNLTGKSFIFVTLIYIQFPSCSCHPHRCPAPNETRPVQFTVGPKSDQHMFQAHFWFAKRHCQFPIYSVALITHGTFDRLQHLSVTLQRWTGPIELTVQVDNSESQDNSEQNVAKFDHSFARQQLTQLCSIHCLDKKLACQVNVHVVMKHYENFTENFHENRACKCDQLPVDQSINPKGHHAKTPSSKPFQQLYAANLLRNIGRIAAYETQKWHFVTDIDIIPSNHAFETLKSLNLKETPEKLAIILPAFETDAICNHETLPSTKMDLKENPSVRMFYQNVNRMVQSKTDYGKWVSSLMDDESCKGLAFLVDWTLPYEPFVVMHRTAPMYDTKFVRYGVNRLSQLAHMDHDDWLWAVHCSLFVVHCGLKDTNSFHKTRSKELRFNQDLLKQFLRELSCKMDHDGYCRF